MKFGVRQIANVVFRAKNTQKIGNRTFQKGQPVFYLDTAKTSSMEGAATTVYATGGRGNTRLIAWEGQKTLTFTVEDALLSPVSFAMLSGAGVVKGENTSDEIHFHQTTNAVIESVETNGSQGTTVTKYYVDLDDALEDGEMVDASAPLYVMKIDNTGDLTGELITGCQIPTGDVKDKSNVTAAKENRAILFGGAQSGTVMVDYYVRKKANTVTELQIDAGHFGGYFYVEADTLFRRQADGQDLPANLTFPNVKIQSNFTFSMAATGDPSTFTFTMDAFPGYTYFDRTKKVLCAIQIVDDATSATETAKTVFPHPSGFDIEESYNDSVDAVNNPDEGDSGKATD